jgi:hypothetical protein
MFDLLINVFIFAIWIGIFVCPLTLFGLRLYYVVSQRLRGKIRLLVLFLPFSLGFEAHASKSKFKTLYDSLLIAFFVLMFLGSLFLFIQYKSI